MTTAWRERPYLLADDLFLVALNDATGRPRLQTRILGAALAGALLGELVIGQHLTVHDGRPYPTTSHPPPDALQHTTLEQLRAEPHHDLRTWVIYLARDAEADVARRLTVARVIQARDARRLFGRPVTTYQPTDQAQAPWRPVRLARLLRTSPYLDWQDRALAGLVAATGLQHHVLIDADDATYAALDAVVAALPPPLAAIVATVHAVAGQAVLTHR